MKDDSTAPNIRLRRINARNILRGHVLRRPHDDTASDNLSLPEGGSQPKIYQFYFHILPTVFFHRNTYDILQFQVSVQHHLSMQVLQSRQHPMHDLLGQFFWVLRGFLEVIPKRAAFAVFRYDVVGGIFTDGLIHLDDIGMV